MATQLLTPEERYARKLASNTRYREQNRTTLSAAQGVRSKAKRAAMTPEERQAENVHRSAGSRRRYHASLEESRIKGAAHQQARRNAMTPEERAAQLLYQRQKSAISRAKQRAKTRAKARQKRLEHGEEMRAAERVWRQAHPGEGNARAIAWAKAHPEKTRASSNKWKAANPEKAKASSHAWKAAHPGKRYPERERAYSLAHAAEARSRAAAWAKANPGRCRIHRHTRRARIRNAPLNDVTIAQLQAVIDDAHGVCVYCSYYHPECKACRKHSHKMTIDHITAVARGGPNTLHNLVACCHLCNSKKRTKPNPVPVQPLLL